MHVKTHRRIIYNNLSIDEKELIQAQELADNERILRRLPFIKDARILIGESNNGPGLRTTVITRDVFPLRFDINPSDIADTRFGISTINLFGTGHELESDIILNDRGDRKIGHDTYLIIRNIAGSFITASLNRANSFSKEGTGVSFLREFYTPNTLYAGGAELSRYTIRDLRLRNGQILSPLTEIDSAFVVSRTRNTQDLWVGRAYKGNNLPAFLDLKRWRIVAAARINRVNFTDRPEATATENEIFHDRTRLLFSVGLSSRNYYKDVLVNFFGRTEDIPAGSLIQLTGGYEYGEFRNRPYLGLRLTKGDFIGNIGYVRGELNTGGFFNKGRFELGVVQTKVGYFTRLFTYRFLKIRHFLDIQYTAGIRRDDLEIIDLDDRQGIRGFSSIQLSGTRRFLMKQESVFFTPLYIAGFRVATFTFFDLGFLNGTQFSGKLYSALGFGVRLRNENLAFNTIQLRFAYYPSPPIDMDDYGFTFSTKIAVPVEDFDLKEPDVVQFR